MEGLIRETNENLKTIINTMKENLDNAVSVLDNIQNQMDKKVEEAKKYKVEVDLEKEKIRNIETDNKNLEVSLEELNEKYSKLNLVSLIETGNKEIKSKINDNVKEINKCKEHIAELTNKAKTIKDLLIKLKKDKTIKEEKLQNLTMAYEFYSKNINEIIEFAYNNPNNLGSYSNEKEEVVENEEINYDYNELENTMVFREIASIDDEEIEEDDYENSYSDTSSDINEDTEEESIDDNDFDLSNLETTQVFDAIMDPDNLEMDNDFSEYEISDEEIEDDISEELAEDEDTEDSNQDNIINEDEIEEEKYEESDDISVESNFEEIKPTLDYVANESTVFEDNVDINDLKIEGLDTINFVEPDFNSGLIVEENEELSLESPQDILIEETNDFSEVKEPMIPTIPEIEFEQASEEQEILEEPIEFNEAPLFEMKDLNESIDVAPIVEETTDNLENENTQIDLNMNTRINAINDLLTNIENTNTATIDLNSIEDKIDNAMKTETLKTINEVESTTLTDIFGNPIKAEELDKTLLETKKIEELFVENGIDFNKFKEDEQNYLKQIYNESKFIGIFNILNKNKINVDNLYNSFNVFGEIDPIELDIIINKLLNIGQSVETVGIVLEKLPKVKKYNLDEAIASYNDEIRNVNITDLIMRAKELYKNGGNN